MHQLVLDSFQSIAHLVFPHCCLGCNRVLDKRTELLCYPCSCLLPKTNFSSQPKNPIEKSFYGRLSIDAATAAFYFSKNAIIHQLLLALKYKGHQEAGWYLGRRLGYELKNAERFQKIDALIPLPLHPNKLAFRGYNQAALICQGIAAVWPKPIIQDAIVRSAFSESQTTRNRIHRWQNMQGVFQLVNKTKIQGKHLLLIDDVATTGATLESCGLSLLEAEPASLSIATVAYTL